MLTVGNITQLTTDKEPLPERIAALPPVRSEPLLADAVTAIRALIEELESYTTVHGADEDDEQALELGREVLRNIAVRGAAEPRTLDGLVGTERK